MCCLFCCFLFYEYGDHRYIHVLTHSFPTRRTSDLTTRSAPCSCMRVPPPTPCSRARPLRRRLPRCARTSSAKATTSRPAVARARRPRRRRLRRRPRRSEEHTSELQSLMRISYAVFCLKKNKQEHTSQNHTPT